MMAQAYSGSAVAADDIGAYLGWIRVSGNRAQGVTHGRKMPFLRADMSNDGLTGLTLARVNRVLP
jgi:hypothetical protein